MQKEYEIYISKIAALCVRNFGCHEILVSDGDGVNLYDVENDVSLALPRWNDKINGLGIVQVENVDHLVELDRKKRVLRFYTHRDYIYGGLSFASLEYTYDMHGGTYFALTCSDNILAYSYAQKGSTHIEILSAKRLPPKKLDSILNLESTVQYA